MPLYEYQCGCGNKEERLLPMQKCNQPQTCVCGKVMQLKVSVSMPAIFTPTGKSMALDTLNSKERGMPNKHWKAQAERLAAAGLDGL